MLVPPEERPAAKVKAVIAAANKIRTKPYVFGGGHARWWDRGYDCSGAVSYALHGGDFLDSPLPSGPMEKWGLTGEGRWITVYANPGHAYAVIAGYRWDTSGGDGNETGPRWHEDVRDPIGFVARHPPATSRSPKPEGVLRCGQRGGAVVFAFFDGWDNVRSR